jgi:hypothetical protein
MVNALRAIKPKNNPEACGKHFSKKIKCLPRALRGHANGVIATHMSFQIPKGVIQKKPKRVTWTFCSPGWTSTKDPPDYVGMR